MLASPLSVIDETLSHLQVLSKFLLDEVGQRVMTSHQLTAERRLCKEACKPYGPLCAPLPAVSIPGKLFCFTGKFASSGTRAQVQEAVVVLGAETVSSPTNKTNYLVIGSIGSTDWIHSTHGRKIEKAVALRDQGKPIHIIAEEHWAECIQQSGAY